MPNISGHNYRTRKAWRRMNQKILRELEETPADVLLAELRSYTPSGFENFIMPPEPSRLQKFNRAIRKRYWLVIDWVTDCFGYAVWASPKNRNES